MKVDMETVVREIREGEREKERKMRELERKGRKAEEELERVRAERDRLVAISNELRAELNRKGQEQSEEEGDDGVMWEEMRGRVEEERERVGRIEEMVEELVAE